MKNHRKLGVLALGAAVALALSACAGTAGGGGGTPNAAIIDNLKVSVGTEPANLNFLQTGDSLIEPFLYNVMEKITKLDSKGNPKPWLATSWKTQGDSFIAQIRQGVTFHNGQKLTAADVAASVNELISIKDSSAAGMISASATGTYELTIKTDGENPEMPRLVSRIPVAPANMVAGHDLDDTIMGTGPYKFVKWDRGSDLVLERNDDYWGAKGTFKTVTWFFRADSASRVSQVEAGEANIAWDVSSADAANLASGLDLVSQPDSIHVILKPNYVAGQKLADPKLRQAVAMAIDVPSIIKGIFGGLADDPKGQLVNAGVLGFDPSLKDVPFDPSKAKQIVKAEGAEGMTLTMSTGPKWDKSKELAQAVEQMLDDVGFKVTTSYDDNAAWRQKYYAFNGGDFSSAATQPDLMIGTTSNQSYTAVSNLISHVCNGTFPGGCDQDFTDAVAQAQSSPDLDARGASYQKAAQIMQKDHIATPLVVLRKNVISKASDNLDIKVTPGFCLYLDGVTFKK